MKPKTPQTKIDSGLSLQDERRVRLDQSGLSPAFFVKDGPARVGRALINELIDASKTSGKANLRICLHSSANDSLHSMLVLARAGFYYRPHKHLTKDESYQLIEGRARLFLFDEKGSVEESCVLEPEGDFLFRVDRGRFHLIVPLTAILVYHESRPGPFQSGDSVFPDWAPDGSDPNAKRFLDQLLAAYSK